MWDKTLNTWCPQSRVKLSLKMCLKNVTDILALSWEMMWSKIQICPQFSTKSGSGIKVKMITYGWWWSNYMKGAARSCFTRTLGNNRSGSPLPTSLSSWSERTRSIIITRPKPAYGWQGLANISLGSARKWCFFVTDTQTHRHFIMIYIYIYHHHRLLLCQPGPPLWLENKSLSCISIRGQLGDFSGWEDIDFFVVDGRISIWKNGIICCVIL